MAAARPRIYLCASEWVALLKGEPGAELVRSLVDRAGKGTFEIVGSELLYLEVLGTGSEDLLATGVHTWAAIDHRIAMRAREMRQMVIEAGRSVQRRTPDLIHIATAAVAGVECFSTNDADCRALAQMLGVPGYDRGQFPEGELAI